MAVSGLLALLDDVANVLDDVSTMSQLAAEKTAKIAEDDLSSALKNKEGKLDPKHEIAVVLAVAKGSLKNKLLYFIPGTFAIAVLAPALITPLCLGSGAYICFEGAKKLLEKNNPHKTAARRAALLQAAQGGKTSLLHYEKERIAQAIKTDAAMSLELAGFQLGMVAAAPLLTKLAVLGVTSVAATAVLYTAIIGVIKMDDLALHLAEQQGDGPHQKAQRAIGRTLLRGASPVMKTIAGVGMTALFYMGGHLMISKIPGVEEAFLAVAERLSSNGGLDKIIETAAIIGTGVIGGVTTLGVVTAVKKPLRYVKTQLSAVYTKHLAAPVAKLGTLLRLTAKPAAPENTPQVDDVIEVTLKIDAPEAPLATAADVQKDFTAAANENKAAAPAQTANDNSLKTTFSTIAADGDYCPLPRKTPPEDVVKAMRPPSL
ncbi:MAG: DUF808 family protein [Micavibrio sp.]|nr:DUF808 family protein [Micavibrio sp.]